MIQNIQAHLWSVMACAYMTAWVGSPVFIDDATHDARSRINSDVRNVSKLIGSNFIMQQDNDPKHTTDATNDFISEDFWLATPITRPRLLCSQYFNPLRISPFLDTSLKMTYPK